MMALDRERTEIAVKLIEVGASVAFTNKVCMHEALHNLWYLIIVYP